MGMRFVKAANSVALGSIMFVVPLLAAASDNSCAVNGITARWAISYCMTRFETDDELHSDVSACFAAELEQLSTNESEANCAANLAYKSAICSILIERRTFRQSLSSCVESDETIPSVVKHGVG